MFKKMLLVQHRKMSLNPEGYRAYLASEGRMMILGYFAGAGHLFGLRQNGVIEADFGEESNSPRAEFVISIVGLLEHPDGSSSGIS